ncbi:MAG: hypothetical protein GXP42_05600 [Chloroflexi bacterium]|nr:hypothetical protein [Chloroflexota bacterium]
MFLAANPKMKLNDELRKIIAGAVAEIDHEQIAITRRLTPAQRVQQMFSMIELVESIAVFRLRQRMPHIGESDALRMIRGQEDGYG